MQLKDIGLDYPISSPLYPAHVKCILLVNTVQGEKGGLRAKEYEAQRSALNYLQLRFFDMPSVLVK